MQHTNHVQSEILPLKWCICVHGRKQYQCLVRLRTHGQQHIIVSLSHMSIQCSNTGYWHQRADERHGNPPEGNQELLVVRDKVGRPQVGLGLSSPWNVIFFPPVLWHCWLGDRKGIRPVKNWMLVCWWWWFDSSFARLIAPVVQLSPPPPSSFASINTG